MLKLIQVFGVGVVIDARIGRRLTGSVKAKDETVPKPKPYNDTSLPTDTETDN
jgi:hypothetical protein